MKYTFSSNSYINLHSALGIPAGASLTISNNTNGNVFLQKGTAAPLIEGAVISPGETFRAQGVEGQSVWVRGDRGSLDVQLEYNSDTSFTLVDFPSSRYTSDTEGFSRLQVDVGQTGFFEAREFRLVRKLVVPLATPIVFKFTSSVDFILFEQVLDVSIGDLEMYAWRESQVTPTGVFSTVVPIIQKNTSSEYKPFLGNRYETAVTITSGGAVTPIDPGVYADYSRAKTSNATAQQTSVGGTQNSDRYLAAGTYYIRITSLSGTSEGTYAIAWEERPSS